MRLKSKIILVAIIFAVVVGVALGVVFGVVMPKIKSVREEQRSIIKIEITDSPKIQYFVGDNVDYSGLAIAIIRKNGDSERVEYNSTNANKFSFSGFDSSKVVTSQKISVTYAGFTTAFYISVKEVPKPDPILTSIAIDVMPKTEYKVGEWLNTDGGMIMRYYADGTYSRTIIINQYVKGWSSEVSNTPGTYTLTVEYKEGGVLKTTTYQITVSE